jgi:2-keto-4-pentenoate hydratase/2-oxohepta-3-ene-1,7-dioic acid hydratase in catechol pathway
MSDSILAKRVNQALKESIIMYQLARFESDSGPQIGLLQEGTVFGTNLGDASWEETLKNWMEGELPTLQGAGIPVGRVSLLPPATNTSRIFCVAQNYPAHAAEAGGDSPPRPIVFMKPTTAFVGADREAEIPSVTRYFDYEGELGVVIGRSGYCIPAARAMSHVVGFTVANDGSSRDLQPSTLANRVQIDWFAAKSSDGASALGPAVAHASEFPDVGELHIQTRHNGELVQDDRVNAVFHPVPKLIEFISSITSLKPGDIILTGTPAGVGKARGVYLAEGDSVEVEISGIGKLTTSYVASGTRAPADIPDRVDMGH